LLVKNIILPAVAKCFGLRLVVQNVQRNIKIYYSDLKAVLKSQSFRVQVIVEHKIILSSDLSPIFKKVKVKESRNRPGVAQRVSGGLGSQIS
jgi:hypothetical protein